MFDGPDYNFKRNNLLFHGAYVIRNFLKKREITCIHMLPKFQWQVLSPLFEKPQEQFK